MNKFKQAEKSDSHWESRVECVTADSHAELAQKLNEFYVGKFIVGTQVFRDNDGFSSLVYFKVKSE